MEDATNSFLGEICFQHVLVMQVSFISNNSRSQVVHEITSNFIHIIHLTPNFIFKGYRGWGCTDDREATSEIDLLAATLLLCLSNLLFLPAVGLAIYRGFYTESFVYFANMVFSTVSCDVIRAAFNHIKRFDIFMLLCSFFELKIHIHTALPRM